MKSIYNFFILCFLAIFISGCGGVYNYDPDYTEKDKNQYYNKVSTIPVILDANDKIITKNFGLSKRSIDFGNINKNVLKDFTSQYFSNIQSINNLKPNDSLYIQSEILDYVYTPKGLTMGNQDLDLTIKVKVLYKNELKLEKIYQYHTNNKVVLRLWSNDYFATIVEFIHEAIFEFYETEFKKDLLEAL